MMSTSALHRGFRWTDLPSTVPEGVATDDMLQQTPDQGSPAPWRIAGTGVWWSTRARSDDRDLLPPALRRGTRPLLRVGFAVTYSETPVGGYHELGGAILYALFGTSRQISTGPSSGLAAVAASAGVGGGSPSRTITSNAWYDTPG